MRHQTKQARPRKLVGDTIEKFHIEQEDELLSFLIAHITRLSKNKIKNALSKKCVLVNTVPTSQFNHKIVPGDTVEIVRKTDNPLFSNRFVRLVYEDQWIIVIDKSIGVLSMQSDHHSFCVKTILDNYFKKRHLRCTAHLVHRLDRDTSGLMVFAKSTQVQQTMENNWNDMVEERGYIALVSGRMEKDWGTIKSWLKDDKLFFTHSSQTDNGGKMAVTHFKTLDRNENHSLVELSLETGRKNQIRVHLQDIKHPVVGDTKYGIEGDDPIGRLGLHAFRLHFTHPITGEPMRFETPYPSLFVSMFQ